MKSRRKWRTVWWKNLRSLVLFKLAERLERFGKVWKNLRTRKSRRIRWFRWLSSKYNRNSTLPHFIPTFIKLITERQNLWAVDIHQHAICTQSDNYISVLVFLLFCHVPVLYEHFMAVSLLKCFFGISFRIPRIWTIYLYYFALHVSPKLCFNLKDKGTIVSDVTWNYNNLHIECVWIVKDSEQIT